MSLDRVQILLHFVKEVGRRISVSGKLQKNVRAVLSKSELGVGKERFTDETNASFIQSGDKRHFGGVSVCFPTFGVAVTLPELNLRRVSGYTQARKGILAQRELTEETEMLLHFLNQSTIREIICEEGTRNHKCHDAHGFKKLSRLLTIVKLR